VPLEIADNRSVAAIASKGPIVDAGDGQRIGAWRRPPSANMGFASLYRVFSNLQQ
jgi:hypothetical protein